ncbi:restriction endonuclease subunit S [Acetobacterium wieringae]|uniref:restriction endonuclease subunit S n=1 Tax=Acetobacterium wieringae TaxID=52694 RepID=UPI0026ECCE47|nr:restriction endonuclease subunit S [Acetobacterium wieringae]
MKETKDGYKKTEIGVLPEDWAVLKLKSLCTKITDGTHKTPQYTEIGIPFLRVTDIQKKEIDWKNVKYISKEEHIQLVKRCKPEMGDILYSKNGTIGIPKIIDWQKEFSIFVSLCLIKVTEGSINKKFLEQFLKSDNCLRQIKLRAKQGTVTNLHLEEIRELEIPLPTVKEQHRIAEILSATDVHLEKLDTIIADTQLLKKALMQQLLTRGIGHTEFKDTEIGEIPKAWEVNTLENICVKKGLVRGPFGGALKKAYFQEKGYKVYEQKNAINKSALIGNYFIDEVKFKELERFSLKEGDFIVSCSGTIGKIFRIPQGFEKGVINQALLKITLDKQKFNDGFFYQYFEWEAFQNKITENTQGGAMKNLVGMDIIKKTLLPIPSLSEQHRIAEILFSIDDRIKLYEKEKTDFTKLKKGLMEQLLTGKIRVN